MRVRDTNYAPTFYNNERALRSVIKFAYIICIDHYLKVEEMPTGHGIADVVFIPKRDTSLPAMIVELKWNKTAKSAIKQIKENHYPELLRDYVGEMILVGISYDENSKEHSRKIEKKAKTPAGIRFNANPLPVFYHLFGFKNMIGVCVFRLFLFDRIFNPSSVCIHIIFFFVNPFICCHRTICFEIVIIPSNLGPSNLHAAFLIKIVPLTVDFFP